MTKYTAEYMLAQVKDKTWLYSIDPTSEALKSVPIPELKEDLSNFKSWYHAVGFHLEYYGLDDLVRCMSFEYPDGIVREDFTTTAHWHRWHHHCLHAYSIIYSRASKVIEQGSMLLKAVNEESEYCPHALLNMIESYKESKIPGSSDAKVAGLAKPVYDQVLYNGDYQVPF